MIKEYLIILFLLTVILGFICLLYATGILKRRVFVTTVENLPIGIFKEKNAHIQEKTEETYIEENSKSDENKLMKCNNENVENKSENDFKKEFSSESLEMLKENNIQGEDIVYWTPLGKHHHKTQNCGTLLRSKVINSGCIDKSGKLTRCHKCNKF
jgi:hypothetical protein